MFASEILGHLFFQILVVLIENLAPVAHTHTQTNKSLKEHNFKNSVNA